MRDALDHGQLDRKGLPSSACVDLGASHYTTRRIVRHGWAQLKPQWQPTCSNEAPIKQ